MPIGYCDHCSFWREGNPRGQGACRARSPHVFADSAPEPIYPITKDSDWCGEFERRETPPKFRPSLIE